MEAVILNYPTYAILSTGHVKDLRSGRIHEGHCRDGYRYTTLKNPDGINVIHIARLVAQAFIPNPDNLPEVDHINRKRDDNRVENIRWANHYTQAQNKGDQKNNKLGLRNIHIEDKYYRVVMKRDGVLVVRKRFATLEEAVACRDEVYNIYNVGHQS